MTQQTAEGQRLDRRETGTEAWATWGPYLAERQWGTVREDYSADGNPWDYFPHDHARSRVYRWGEDGIGGISDDTQTLCFAPAFWNGQDPILKERLFGLSNAEGNHGEDVKELYYYLDNTPTHAYMKMLYKYPQAAFPYEQLIAENRNRTARQPEFELIDTGLFDEGRYFDIFVEYAKAAPEDLLIRLTIHNRGPEAAPLAVLPTLWFRNRWAFGDEAEPPRIERMTDPGGHSGYGCLRAEYDRLGTYTLCFANPDQVLITDNETNTERLYGHPNRAGSSDAPFVKDAFHGAIIDGSAEPFASRPAGTKAAPVYRLDVPAGKSVELRLRLSRPAADGWPVAHPLGDQFTSVFVERQRETDAFYADVTKDDPSHMPPIKRLAWAGLLWNKQYYHYDVDRWLRGDPGQPAPPPERAGGRNAGWRHVKAEDIMLMPDKWEYPWFASWDLAFHARALCPIDVPFAKRQLLLLTSERYRTADGSFPAYEWDFSDNNPPVEAPVAWNIYRFEKKKYGAGDTDFLRSVYEALKPNYTWWVSQKDPQQNNVFEGGFLGLDNVSVFDRSAGIPADGQLEQADGTSWMAMYSLSMMQIAIELAQTLPEFEEAAVRLFEQYVRIADSMQQIAQIWVDDPKTDKGFFYDVLLLPNGEKIPLEIRSIVGLAPLFGVFTLRRSSLDRLPRLADAVREYLKKIRDVERDCYLVVEDDPAKDYLLFSILTCEQLDNLVTYLFNEDELLAPGGIRSLSKIYAQEPYTVQIDGESFTIEYRPGESDSRLFGGNSNWRGPVWLPMNHILIYALRRFGYYYDKKRVELPIGSGNWMGLFEASEQIGERILSMFLPDANGRRPAHGDVKLYETDPHFRDLVLFYEHYDGDTARGLGASHQTGWSALVTLL